MAPGEECATERIPPARMQKGPLVARLSFNPQGQVQVDDGYLIALAKQGDPIAYDRIVRRYYGFVRLKASSYFLAGGDADDLIQEGLVGLYKAVRDYRTDRESSFRNFAELCITRQIITAVKTATRNKHTPLNQYVSFSATPASAQDGEPTLDEVIPGSPVHAPVNQVISSEELQSLVSCLSTALSELESRVLSLYLDGYSYEQVGERLGCDTKTVDNALQRVKRKVGTHLNVQVCADLALDALQGVVDRLGVAAEALADLLVAVAVEVERQDAGLELRQRRRQAGDQRLQLLGADDLVDRGV